MLAAGATAPAADEQTTTDPLWRLRQRLEPALQGARDALAANRKSDLAAALSSLLETTEEAIGILERSVASLPSDTPSGQASDAAGPAL